MARMGTALRAYRTVRRARQHDGDAGMTLIELMWAMVIFAFVATATVGALEMSLKTVRSDRSRVAASDLAARELEISRNTFTGSASGPTQVVDATNPDPLSGGTAGQPLVVDNVPYTVTRNTEWIVAGTGKSPCDGGATVAYPSMSVTVTVTWSQMGSTQPVSANTILTPSKNWVSSSGFGYAAVKVLDSTAAPVKGTTVTLTKSGAATLTDTTADDGCAVFQTSTTGTWAASINNAGYVDFYGNQNATKNVTIAVGSLTQATINYDKAATATVVQQTQSGYNLPTSLPFLTFANTGLQPTGTRYVQAAGTATTVTSLWPFSDGYTMWAGQCAQADPAASGGTRSPAVVMGPGTTNSATVQLTGAALTVRTAAGVPVTNATVTATPLNTSGCATTENPLTLGVTDTTGVLKTSLPAGAWTLKVSGKSPSGSWPNTPVLLPTSSPIAVTVTTT
jgi:prepilin-type N-terminal cleavage/methylation domain-containing protein